MLRWYLVHFNYSLQYYCYAYISCTIRILFHGIIALVSRAILGFPFVGLLR